MREHPYIDVTHSLTLNSLASFWDYNTIYASGEYRLIAAEIHVVIESVRLDETECT